MESSDLNLEAYSYVIKDIIEKEKQEEIEEKKKNGTYSEAEEGGVSEGKSKLNWMFIGAVLLVGVVFAYRLFKMKLF